MLRQREMALEQLAVLADRGYVFAIVDSSSGGKSVLQKAGEIGEQGAVSLFRGTDLQDYYAVAPYLFAVNRALMEWISAHLDGSCWGVYVFTKASLEELARHLQRFLLVLLPDNHKWFFRYYDPRILQAYLPCCQPAELQEFFGPVRGFATLDAERKQASVFECSPSSAQDQTMVPFPAHPSGLWPIRLEQLDALRNASKDDFVKQVAAHVQEFFPQECSAMNQPELHELIDFGIQRAGSYGINMEQHVCQYIDLMLAFGRNFDQQPWAAAVLKDGSITLSSGKLERLYEAARTRQAREGTAHVR